LFLLFALASSVDPVYLLTEESDPSLNPTTYIEGLPAYVRPTLTETGEKLGQFLLNTSGTISYMFTNTLPTNVQPEVVYFKDYPSIPIEVYFAPITLSLPLKDRNDTFHDVTYDMGFISAEQY